MSPNITLLGFNLLLFILVWKYVVRPTALDTCRDIIFDLRQEAHDYFSERSMLNSAAYAHLRDMLNAYLRFTDQLTFTSVFGAARSISQRKELYTEVRRAIDAPFANVDTETQKFVKEVRAAASHAVQGWVFHSSVYSCVVLYVVGAALTAGYLVRCGGKIAIALAASRPSVDRFRDRQLDGKKIEALPSLCLT